MTNETGIFRTIETGVYLTSEIDVFRTIETGV